MSMDVAPPVTASRSADHASRAARQPLSGLYDTGLAERTNPSSKLAAGHPDVGVVLEQPPGGVSGARPALATWIEQPLDCRH
jgi:hypothetical protein